MRQQLTAILALALSVPAFRTAHARRNAESPVGKPMVTAGSGTRDALSARKPRKRRRRRPRRKSKAGRLIVGGLKEFKAQRYSAAINRFEKATRTDSTSANAFFHLGNAYYHRAFSGGAPENADKDDARNAVDAYETALAIDERLTSVKDPFLLYHGLAQSYDALGRYPDALKAIRSATKASRRNPMPHLYGARIRYKMRDFEMSQKNFYYSVRRARRVRAYPALAQLIKTDPMFSSLLTIPQNKLILEVYDALHNGTLTEEEAKERIRGYRPYRDALSNLPTRKPGSFRTPDSDPRDPEVVRRIEEAHLAFNHERYRQAISAYQDALSVDSQKGTLDLVQKSLILERIGASYLNLGLAGEAVRVLRHAVRTMPNNSAAHYQLALAYSVNGELGNALSSLNRALDNATTLPQLRKTLLLARTDSEFEPLKELTRYREIIKSHSRKLVAMR